MMSVVVVAVVVAASVLVLRRARRPPHVVAVRRCAALQVVNLGLVLPCLLKDWLGYGVPVVGYMLGVPLSLDTLMRVAERRTGLSDWGASDSFPKLFSLAVDRLAESRPSPFGRLVAFDYLMRRLVVRLRVVDAVKKRTTTTPTGGARPPPIFVVGLPRCGTTFLHRLLALDPALRYPETHELLDPLPKAGLTYEKRVAYWEKKLALIRTLVPHVEAIHELGATEAEECLLALSVEVPLLPPTFRHLVRHCVTATEADGRAFPDLREAPRVLSEKNAGGATDVRPQAAPTRSTRASSSAAHGACLATR